MQQESFTSGMELSRILSATIEPRLREAFPAIPLALAFIGPGSDVLGYDTARSMDHDWGPRLTIVVPDDAAEEMIFRINADLHRFLPSQIAGFPTRYAVHADGTTFPDATGLVHRLEVVAIAHLLQRSVGIDTINQLDDAAWLSTPMQSLLELTSGEVFADDTGELTALLRALCFYPEPVLRYQLSALWMRIAQIQPFIGRTGETGDDAGSATITASIARDMMRIGLLQTGHYAPYAKWLGTAFGRTRIGDAIQGELASAVTASDWHAREGLINRAGLELVGQLNRLDLIPPVPAETMQFHTRPFHVLPAESISQALHASLNESPLASLPPCVGGIDVVTDSTDALKSQAFRTALSAMYAKPDRLPAVLTV